MTEYINVRIRLKRHKRIEIIKKEIAARLNQSWQVTVRSIFAIDKEFDATKV